MVARYYGGRVETNAFAVADAAIAGRHGEALIALRHALDSGADPVPIVAAFAMKVRTPETRAISSLAAADAAVKGAERDPVFALERLIGVISARVRDVA